jgi:hypothetical protein
MSKYNCPVFKCFNKNFSQHRFLNPLRDRISFRICGIHFAPEDFTSDGRLSRGAYPEQPAFEGK